MAYIACNYSRVTTSLFPATPKSWWRQSHFAFIFYLSFHKISNILINVDNSYLLPKPKPKRLLIIHGGYRKKFGNQLDNE